MAAKEYSSSSSSSSSSEEESFDKKSQELQTGLEEEGHRCDWLKKFALYVACRKNKRRCCPIHTYGLKNPGSTTRFVNTVPTCPCNYGFGLRTRVKPGCPIWWENPVQQGDHCELIKHLIVGEEKSRKRRKREAIEIESEAEEEQETDESIFEGEDKEKREAIESESEAEEEQETDESRFKEETKFQGRRAAALRAQWSKLDKEKREAIEIESEAEEEQETDRNFQGRRAAALRAQWGKLDKVKNSANHSNGAVIKLLEDEMKNIDQDVNVECCRLLVNRAKEGKTKMLDPEERRARRFIEKMIFMVRVSLMLNILWIYLVLLRLVAVLGN